METTKLDFEHSDVMLWNYNSTYRYRINQGGTWSGKTYSILQALLVLSVTDKKPTVTTVTGQDVPHLKDGPIKDASRIVESSELIKAQIDRYNKSEKQYYFKNGSTLHFKSYEDEQDAKSGKRQRLFVNEANGMPYKIFSKLEERTTDIIFIDYNPDAEFWVHEEILPRPDAVRFISNCFEHNATHTPAHVKANILRKGGKDKNYLKVYGYGVTGKIEGLIFPNVYKCKHYPKGCKKEAYGLDFGFTNDPTALIKMGVQSGELWGKEMFYKKGLRNRDIYQLLQRLGIPKWALIVADSAEPKSIADLRAWGYNVKAAKKGKDSINFGIDLINQYNLNITEDSVNWHKEARRYKWSMHKKKGDLINKPIDDFNHCWDPARYWAMEKISKSQGGQVLAFGGIG